MRKGLVALGYIALFIVGLTLLLFPLSMRGADGSPNYGKAIITTRKIVMNETSFCSATVIGPHTLWTAAHCLGAPHISIKVEPSDKKDCPQIEFIESDNYDHDIVYLSGITFSNFAEVADKPPALGDDVFIIGNPVLFTQVLRKGYYIGTRKDPDFEVPQYLFDMNAFFGDSGAALFNSRGQIISTVSTLPSEVIGGVAFRLVGVFPSHFTAEQLQRAREWQP